MNKRDIQEIKKQFTPENCAITRIAGCYVDGEKEKKMEDEKAFLSLPEEYESWWAYLRRHRQPNKALIRDNLRNVARMGFQLANLEN